MVQFPPKFMINGTILILIWSISLFWMAMSPGVSQIGYTYLKLLDSSNLSNFNYRNKALTAKLLRQGYRYFKLRKAFSKFYRRHSALVEKFSVGLKTTYKRIGYSQDIMRQTACLVVNPSLLMAMLNSLIARRRFGPQTQ